MKITYTCGHSADLLSKRSKLRWADSCPQCWTQTPKVTVCALYVQYQRGSQYVTIPLVIGRVKARSALEQFETTPATVAIRQSDVDKVLAKWGFAEPSLADVMMGENYGIRPDDLGTQRAFASAIEEIKPDSISGDAGLLGRLYPSWGRTSPSNMN